MKRKKRDSKGKEEIVIHWVYPALIKIEMDWWSYVLWCEWTLGLLKMAESYHSCIRICRKGVNMEIIDEGQSNGQL